MKVKHLWRRLRDLLKGQMTMIWLFPEYDLLTSLLGSWRSLIRESSSLQVLYGSAVSAKALLPEGLLGSHTEGKEELALVFVGHGVPDALLTDPTLGLYPARYEGKHSELLSLGSLAGYLGSLNVFSFACYSVRGLGRRVAELGGCYVGYDDLIPFIITEDGSQVDEVFLGPLRLVEEDLRKRRRIDLGTKERVENYYQQELSKLRKSPAGSRGSLLRVALRKHKSSLRIQGGDRKSVPLD